MPPLHVLPPRRPSLARPEGGLRVGIGAALLALSAGACTSADPCLTDRQFFEQKVWGQVLSKSCIKCHSPDGVASAANAKFELLTSAYPAFLDANYDNVSFVSRIQFDGASELLQKPIGQLNHGGGLVLKPDSDELKILTEMVARFKTPTTCTTTTAQTTLAQKITLLDAPGTLRKAAITLAGRLPTAAETQRARDGGEAELGKLIDELMQEDAFYTRVKEIYNDLLLTNRYYGWATQLLDDDDYPHKLWWNPRMVGDDQLTDDEKNNRWWAEVGISQEPLELVAWVVRNGRPFSEILTADYTVVNAYSARTYGLDPAQLGYTDAYPSPYEYRQAHVTIQRDGQPVKLAHAGVLSNPIYLHRFPTTDTNLNRHRARMLLANFLATDILKVADRPLDPSSVTSLNPTRDDPNCHVCHKTIDPIAGTFQKWDANGRFQPTLEWPAALPPPGFGQDALSNVNDYPSALGWLAQRVTNDPRFVVATIHAAYRGFLGQEPLAYPVDGDPDFDAHLTAWRNQEETFGAIANEFNARKMDYRVVVKGLVLSSAFRAIDGVSDKPAELEGLGTGRLLTPEMLDRKIVAVAGLHWRYGADQDDLLPTWYQLLYGGIDSDNVTKRLTAPNGMMASVSVRMANEVACWATAYDFTRPASQRVLFPLVEPTNRPEDDSGYPVPHAMANVRANVQYLHERILGESLPLDDPEIERTYQLFLKTFRELQAARSVDIAWECRGRWDRDAGKDLPDERLIDQDRYYTIRAWQAVVTYLLQDEKFLYE